MLLLRNWMRSVCFAIFAATAALAHSATNPGDLITSAPNPFPGGGETFGRTVAVAPGGRILTGAQHDSVGVVPSGSIYTMNPATGLHVLKIDNPAAGNDDRFGAFVWGTSSLLVAGAFQADVVTTDSGAVYTFNSQTGALVHTIPNPTPAQGDWFGYSVNAVGDNILAGARFDDTGANDTGSAYLFSGATGALIRAFNNPFPVPDDNFGYSVAGVGGTRVIVGCPGKDAGANDSGAAYVFNASTGQLEFTLLPPAPVANGNFGFLVRARGTDFLVGSPAKNEAYLFSGSNGQLLRTFTHPEPGTPSFFGAGLGSTASGDIIISDPMRETRTGSSGVAYVFDRLTYQQKLRLLSPVTQLEQLGVSVTGLGDDIVVGAHFTNLGAAVGAGNTYLYKGAAAPVTTADGNWLLVE